MTSPVRTSETTDQLDEAMAAAQVELENPTKSKTAKVAGTSKKTGQDFEMTYAYADISDLLSACRPVLAKHGVAIFQIPRMVSEGRSLLITTRLSFKGQWIEGDYPVCDTGVQHQDMGKAMTYARRYALGAMIGVAPEKDDDGQGAAHTPRPPQNQPRSTNVRPSAPAQVALTAINTATTRADLKAWSDLHRDALVDLISAEEYDQIGVVFKRRWNALPPIPKEEPKPPEPEPKPEPEPSADELFEDFPGDQPAPEVGSHDPETGEVTDE